MGSRQRDALRDDTRRASVVTNIFPTICADDVAATREFYRHLFEFETLFDSGWYVQLGSPDDPTRQIGIVQRSHETVPARHRQRPAGVLVSIEVDDVDRIHERAARAGWAIVHSLRSEDFGQRHFMVLDPAGTLVDVITPIEPSPEMEQFGVTAV